MRPGLVVTQRVNPKDCMSVVDVIKATGMNVRGMSFPAMVSLTLSSLLEQMRQQGIIPTRDGFEYLEIMQPYLGSGRNKRKLEITGTLHELGSRMRTPTLADTHAPLLGHQMEVREYSAPIAEEVVSAEVRRARTRLAELCAKKDLAENGGAVWAERDEVEFQELYVIVYPEG